MSDCKVIYKGTTYSRNEFAELLYKGEIDVLMPKLDFAKLNGDLPGKVGSEQKTDSEKRVELLRGTKLIETNRTKTEYGETLKLAYRPVYENTWTYADNTDPDRRIFATVDEAVNDLDNAERYDEASDYYEPYKESVVKFKEVWLDENGDEYEDGSVLSYEDFSDANKDLDIVKKLGEFDGGVLGVVVFPAAEETANDLESEVYNNIGSEIERSIVVNGRKLNIRHTGKGKYSRILVEDENGNDVGGIELRISNHTYNPARNTSGGDFISVEINNRDKGKYRPGAYQLKFDGGNTFSEVADAVNKKVEEIIGGWSDSKTPLQQAGERLKKAWDAYKNSGIAVDKFQEVKREAELVKAAFNYAWVKGLNTAKEIYDYLKGAFSGITDKQAKDLSDKVKGIVDNPDSLVDAVLGVYAPIIEEQGLEIKDVKDFVQNTFYKGGDFNLKMAQDWLKNETEGINEQEKKLWEDVIQAANDQRNIKTTPRETPQAEGGQQPQPEAQGQPQAQPQTKEAKTEQQNIEWANSLLGGAINKENFPNLLFSKDNKGGKEGRRESAETQEDVFERKVTEDASYIRLTLKAISEVAQDDARAALDKFGENWISDILGIFESGKLNMSAMTRTIGLLSYISNDLNNKITSGEYGGKELAQLIALQNRADKLSIEFSSWASAGLNTRKLLRKFATGDFAMSDLSARVVGPDVARMVEETMRIMSEKESNEALNEATAPVKPTTRRKSARTQTKQKGTTEQDRQNVINDAIAERRKQGKEGVSRQDLIDSIRERLNKCK